MPSASYSPPRRITDVDQAISLLREEGLRVSASRRVVLEGLLRADGPVSAEYLASGLDGLNSSCDLPSAYRNLELFERLGLVRHVHIGHGPGLYALVGHGDDAYLVCERCNQLSRLPASEMEAIRSRIGERTGFEAHFTHFPILGLCRECAGEPPESGEHGEHAHEHSHGDHVHSHPRRDGTGDGADHRHSRD